MHRVKKDMKTKDTVSEMRKRWQAMRNGEQELPICIGKASGRENCVVDLGRMPHLLVGGESAYGKTTLLHSIICGLASSYSPDELQIVLYSSNSSEFSCYEGLPHLVVPVMSKVRDLVYTLHWAVAEAERRDNILEDTHTGWINRYNERVASNVEKMPYVVVVADEIVRLMMAGKKAAGSDLMRLLAMGSQAGIHLVFTTFCLDSNILTKDIRECFPGRIAFMTENAAASRVIIGEDGGESLENPGDMVVRADKSQGTVRAHGAVLELSDVKAVVADAVARYGEYHSELGLTRILVKQKGRQS